MTRDLLVLILQKLGFGRRTSPEPPKAIVLPVKAAKAEPHYRSLNRGRGSGGSCRQGSKH